MDGRGILFSFFCKFRFHFYIINVLKVVTACLSVCTCVYPHVSLPNEGFAWSLLNGKESLTRGRYEGHFTEIFNTILEGIKSLSATDPDNKQYYKHHCLSSNIRMLHLILMADIHL